jgi:hypothetical protein
MFDSLKIQQTFSQIYSSKRSTQIHLNNRFNIVNIVLAVNHFYTEVTYSELLMFWAFVESILCSRIERSSFDVKEKKRMSVEVEKAALTLSSIFREINYC